MKYLIHIISHKKFILVLPSLLFLIPSSSFADGSGSIAVTLTYTNGDTADYWPVSLKIYQDSNQTPYKEIESIAGNPFNIVSLPIGHQYKIVAYANSMYSSVAYVNLEQPHQDVTIKLPIPGGMRINAFYSDGLTPITNATVYVRDGQLNKTWAHGVTNANGDSLRFWIEPTTSPGDHYIVDIRIGDHLVYSTSPVYLRPGISQEVKVTTNWPPIVNSLVTVTLFSSQSHAVVPSDGKFLVNLFDSTGKKISDSPVTPRGDAYFSNLKVGDYTFKAIKTDDNSEWATANITEDGTITAIKIQQEQKTTPVTSPVPPITPSTVPSTNSQAQPIPNCNCVVFRLDNVQDYWLDDVQIKIIDSFDNKGAGITVGIIGKAFGNDTKLVNYLKSKIDNSDIAIGGWSFEDYTTLTKDQQSDLLQQSKTKISNMLGVTPTVFIPPYGKINNDTLYSSSSNNIKIISGSPISISPDLAANISSYPANIFSGVIAQNTNQSMLNEKILSSIKDTMHASGYAIVTLNFQYYAQDNGTVKTNVPDMQKIQDLQSLIDSIRSNGYHITTISELPNSFKSQAPWTTSVYQWSQDKISSTDLLKSLVQHGTIQDTGSNLTTIPSWVKHNAKLHTEGQISDDEFLNAIQYLVKIHAIK